MNEVFIFYLAITTLLVALLFVLVVIIIRIKCIIKHFREIMQQETEEKNEIMIKINSFIERNTR